MTDLIYPLCSRCGHPVPLNYEQTEMPKEAIHFECLREAIYFQYLRTADLDKEPTLAQRLADALAENAALRARIEAAVAALQDVIANQAVFGRSSVSVNAEKDVLRILRGEEKP
jgi:hypothetical protein